MFTGEEKGTALNNNCAVQLVTNKHNKLYVIVSKGSIITGVQHNVYSGPKSQLYIGPRMVQSKTVANAKVDTVFLAIRTRLGGPDFPSFWIFLLGTHFTPTPHM